MWDSKIKFDSELQSYVFLKDGHIDSFATKVKACIYSGLNALYNNIGCHCVTLIVVLDV